MGSCPSFTLTKQLCSRRFTSNDRQSLMPLAWDAVTDAFESVCTIGANGKTGIG